MSIRIIGAAIGNGAQVPESAKAPDYLRESGLVSRCEDLIDEATPERFQEISWDTTLYPHYTRRFNRPLPVVTEFVDRLQKVVGRVVANGDFPLVLGGDHSCAIGTWSGVSRVFHNYGQGDIGLLWIDAHMDSHTFETTPSQAIHGMPLAILLGHGTTELLTITGEEFRIKPENVVLVGVRSYEQGEKELLDELGVKVFDTDDIRRDGLTAVLNDALRIVRSNDKFWGMSIDLDAFDPKQVPGVGSPEEGGIDVADFLSYFKASPVNHDANFRCLEVVELAPSLDAGNLSRTAVFNLVTAVLLRNSPG